ncbi:MAG: 3-oxoacyl-ACP reductase FabG [Armatimonadetes bacterium]|nr:3-oxoacyl-ACP reductase FabG [Armatimonadota bacterium]MBI2972531.1 3-oxoacyl-ACP reductase FabG [Armatimonadota bacterium]
MKLEGRRAIVTGAGRGIGRVIALHLAAAGADVLVNSVTAAHVEAVAEEIRNTGRRAIAVEADVTDWDAVVEMVSTARAELGGLEILVNNAGIIRRGTLDTMTLQDWHDVIAVNLTGTFYCCRAAAPLLKASGWGRVINITSIAAKVGDITSAPGYGPSKAGVIALTKTLARELAPWGVTVNAVAPHTVEIGMSTQMPTERRAAIAAGIPLGRLATAEEVAGAVTFLASPEAGFITGETLNVNGGASMD